VSYPSMRPSSSIPSSAGKQSPSGSDSSSSTGSSSSPSGGGQGQGSLQGSGPQYGFRSSSQNRGYSSGIEYYGTPGFIEEGTMVRQRQELIRLPDVSK